MAGQQTQHDFLAVDRRQRGNTHVELVTVAVIKDTPVLRKTLLRNIQIGENLDLIDQRRVLRPLDNIPLGQLAVDTKPDAAAVFIRLQMNVAGIIAECFPHERHQKSLPGGNIRQTTRHGDSASGIRTVIFGQQVL